MTLHEVLKKFHTGQFEIVSNRTENRLIDCRIDYYNVVSAMEYNEHNTDKLILELADREVDIIDLDNMTIIVED